MTFTERKTVYESYISQTMNYSGEHYRTQLFLLNSEFKSAIQLFQ